MKEGDGWTITAAGPTTSIREEPYQAEIIRRYGVRAVIGKGGMGAKTLAALKEHGAVYLNAIGGAAQFYARMHRADATASHCSEFGTPEAMWHLRVNDFPAIVTMDAHGNSLHKDIEPHRRRNWSGSAPPVRRSGSTQQRLRSVRAQSPSAAISAVHCSLVQIHGRQILDREQRKRGRGPPRR